MQWALVDKDNIVRNIIIYEEGSDYVPLSWLTLEQVNDWVNIDDHKDIPDPNA